MHSALKEVHCSNAGEMLEEKESDVNVMDFVETEYNADEQEDMANQIDPKRRSLRRQKMTVSSVGSQPDDKFNSSHSSRSTKKYFKKRRKKGITDSKLVENCVENQRGLYPYAMMLKGVCEEVGKFHPPEPVTSEKIFKKLLPANINYPYASLLQELHQTCKYRQSDVLSVCDHQHQTEVSQIMKSINQRIPVSLEEIDSEQINNDFESPFSGALLGMILKEKIQSNPNEDSRSTKSFGQILSNCMNEFYEDNPLQEMRSSSLLLKLSLLAEKESQANQNDVRTLETAASWAESDQEDMVDCKPYNRKAGFKFHTVGVGSLKRASLRKKKGIMKFDASPPTNNSRKSKSKLSSISNQEPKLLLQLILGRNVNHSEIQGTGKETCRKLDTRSNVLKKIRSKIKDRMKDVESKPQANSHQKKCKKALSRPTEEECHKTKNLTLETTEQQQSLLKEYLLKPAGQENLLKSESDIPKLSTNSFLFSRLLQNFKSLSENSLSEDSLNNMGESSGSNILREMLLQSCSKHASEPNNDSDDEQIDEKPFQILGHVYAPSIQSSADDFVDSNDPQGDRNCEEKMENNTVSCRNILREILTGSQCTTESHYSNNSEESQDTKNITLREHLQLPSSEKDSSENDSTDPGSPVCEIKCEVKCEDEFLEDIFECPICHLEFSLEVDLSDHQMLFHCDEVQAASPACIIPHATDNVQNSLFLEKLPA